MSHFIKEAIIALKIKRLNRLYPCGFILPYLKTLNSVTLSPFLLFFSIITSLMLAMQKHNIVDCHHHLWDLQQQNHPWLLNEPKDIWIGDYQALCVDFLISDFKHASTKANIVKSVHIQALTQDPIKETAWLQAQSDELSLPSGIVFYADLSATNIEHIIQQHMKYKNVRGIRQIINEHNNPKFNMCPQHGLMRNKQWLKGFSLLAQYQLSFDLQCYDYQLPQASLLATQFPHTQIILNHMGMPIKRDSKSLDRWRYYLSDFAKNSNTAIKLSGLAMLDHPMNEALSQQMIQDAIAIFGWQRVVFGSNFPVDRLFHDYDDWFDLVSNAIASLNQTQQQAIWQHNAERLYRI
ncbi:amidohydrolase family protein [uncultured Shewanella sp.]|uniref:amidohydrolase family protein n=1 Tax=uncultured Shewanella sp. TaxID=173975 RepID=UPI002608960F|nr:amidohydrolase family protein [uncultured Shewanella sp.]